ncbi:MAG: SDR family oxidoreductase [Candidatus Dormibacteraeota bacterium]|nr:SDR family oxidoreductase [Candidatus Dormibacteraeota bacterium]
MGPRLRDKVCIVTGAGSGIGRATARLFAQEGAHVIVADRDDAAAAETVAEATGDLVAEHVDVTDPASCDLLAEAVNRRHQRIDALFNNAGIPGVGLLHETSVELWERVFAVNVRGVFLMSRSVVPHMMRQRAGSIINMSSTIAEIGLANRASYGASKGAVLALTRCMQVDYAPFDIRVNALLPGTIGTPFVEKYLRESYPSREEGLVEIRKRQLGGELGKPEDVAWAALYLASDESKFVMGSGMYVDGGVRGGK